MRVMMRFFVLATAWTWALGTALCSAGGFTVGVEGGTLFSQEFKLKTNPTVTRVITDNLTSVTRTLSNSYFKETILSSGSTTNFTTWNGAFTRKITLPSVSTLTVTRDWSNINHNAQYLFVKASYSTEYLEGILKLGTGTHRLTRKETSTLLREPPGAPAVATTDNIQTNLADLPAGFAYAFHLRGQPYQTDSFHIITDLHFEQAMHKGITDSFVSVGKSTSGATIGQTSVFRSIDMDQFGWGLAVSASMNLGAVQPYMGLSYADGSIKGIQRTSVLDEVYTSGALTEGTTTIETVEYLLKPKVPISLLLGLTFPFDRGAITIEGKVQGQNMLTLSGFIGF